MIRARKDSAVEAIPPPLYTESEPAIEVHESPEKITTESQKSKSYFGEMEVSQRTRPLAETGDAGSEFADEEFEDETIIERLVGLTEMFPKPLRDGVYSLSCLAVSGIHSAFNLSKSVSWFFATTATVCFLPLFLELERVQTEEQEAAHQRTIMLGPRAAAGGSSLAGFSAVPHIAPLESK
ncbi:hypothetical protein T265_04301 [Opisthorchis viverrini]|uniref:Mitochondrial import receptor subunit TOM22 homolog n=1 Tax=Opisthorchis viverrini TaxID=6198 RepID=A0A075A0C5_OPIVI|nr:hypothetical protein T265_04301 [Opisthorchis viverrini]KER29010.1 hypothetical protein T265_04301 [Opisthorchis viverrini]